MAGFYADEPGPRIAWDRNGSVGFKISNTNVLSVMTTGEMEGLNDEDAQPFNGSGNISLSVGSANGASGKIGIVFPHARDIAGASMGFQSNGGSYTNINNRRFEWSADTTNGQDGVWTSLGTPSLFQDSITGYRTTINSYALTGVKGFRFAWDSHVTNPKFSSFHVYGELSSLSVDKVEFWHPTNDEPLSAAYFDWGDTYQGQTPTVRQFRVKNLSATLTANTVTLSLDARTDTASPTTVSQHSISADGTNYASSQVISSIAPGAISSVHYLKWTPDANALVGLRAARMNAVVGSMS